MRYKTIRIGKKCISEHTLIAERVLGKKLPDGALVHHWDRNKQNNENKNLAIFPSDAYHRLIHTRMDSFENTGHPDWLKCQRCHKWDDPENGLMWVGTQTRGTGLVARHRACQTEYTRNLKKGKSG